MFIFSFFLIAPFQSFEAEFSDAQSSFCFFFNFFFFLIFFNWISRWWFSSPSTSTSPGSMWWKWTRTGQRTPANQGESRLSPSPRRNSSPSQPTRIPTYERRSHLTPHPPQHEPPHQPLQIITLGTEDNFFLNLKFFFFFHFTYLF